jgi:DNA-binding MarR family transcriptional regulator
MPSPAPPRTHFDLESTGRLRMVLGQLSRRLRPTLAVREHGLTPTRTTVLLRVERHGPLRVSELAEAEGLNPTMLSRVLGELAEAGLVARETDPRDRRAAWATATVAGRELAERIRSERNLALNQALRGLDDGEREAIDRAVPALEALAERLRQDLP